MATSMELLQRGERFRILDPPSLPIRPIFPNRLKFFVFGLAFGLALGVIVAGGLEWMDDTVYNEHELKALLPVAAMAEIPIITTPGEKRAEEKKIWVGWATATVVCATMVVGYVVTYFKG